MPKHVKAKKGRGRPPTVQHQRWCQRKSRTSGATVEGIRDVGASCSNDRQPIAQSEVVSLSDSDESSVDEICFDSYNTVPLRDQSLDDQNFLALRGNFIQKMNTVSQLTCIYCNERHFVDYKINSHVCHGCRSVKTNRRHKFSAANELDPGPLVRKLSGLTAIEQMLISQVIPSMTIFCLSRGGQFGFRGHVLNVPQDLYGFITNLPRKVSELDFLVLAKGVDQLDLSRNMFTVNRQRVVDALKWLQCNNPYYHNIKIDQEMVEALPINGMIAIPETHINREPVDDAHHVPVTSQTEEHLQPEVSMSHSFIPHQLPTRQEREAINAAIQSSTVLDWPEKGDTPVNEFNTVGYIARAFPCLFPTGKADLRAARQVRVTPKEYFQHLLAYKDGRFQADPRFLFLAYNSMLRWQSLQVGRVFVCNSPFGNHLTVEDLRELAQKDQRQLTNRVLHFGSQIRGTPQYWYTQQANLIAMVEQFGPATIFFTFSAADHQWPDLLKFLDTESQNTAQAIAHAPFTVDSYIILRFELFYKHFLKPYLNIKDHWYRVEWQHRGSLHIHGLAWLTDSLDTKTCSVAEISSYWDRYVSTWNTAIKPEDNPINFYWQVAVHPCARTINEIHDLDEDLKDLINTCQKHTRCSAGYCLRTQPGGRQLCRFGFPKPLLDNTTATFSCDEEGERIKLDVQPATNDPLPNKFNCRCLSTWRANMDISVTFKMTDVANYIAKYASKSEKATTDYVKIFKQLVTQELPVEASLQRSASGLLLKTVGNMDICAQQAAHVISSLPLYRCSRHIVLCYVDGEVIQDELGEKKLSDIRKYLRRPSVYEHHSFFEMIKMFTMKEIQGNIRCGLRTGEAVIRILPKFSCDPKNEQYDKYCMQYLVLHKPFRRWDQLVDGFVDASAAYANLTLGREDVHKNFQEVLDATAAGLNYQDEGCLPQVEDVDQWMTVLDVERPIQLAAGLLPVQQLDWKAASEAYHHLIPSAKSFLIESKAQVLQQQHLQNPPSCVDPAKLNTDQRTVYNSVLDHMNSADNRPLHALVLGTAGTGKSYLIHCLEQILSAQCMVLAPTGVAALNINGQTIHSFFQFAKFTQVNELWGTSLQTLQDKCESLKYIIIDELSMVSNKLLYAIDQRLRPAFPKHSDAFFGACSVIMFGDLGQLPPVGDSRMFMRSDKNEHTLHGFAAFCQFNTVYHLKQCVRQADDHAFRELLLRLRDGNNTFDDYELLSKRFRGSVTGDMTLFVDAIHLFPTHEKVDDYNSEKLLQPRQPVAYIEASHNCVKAKQATSNIACGLQRFLSLSEGCKVMLRANLWVAKGLVNGSIGHVMHIIYSENGPPSLPSVVICNFPGYTGPSFLPDHPHSFPIVPIQRIWHDKSTVCSRTALPLSLAWALTIHKSQGLTLPQAAVDIGDHEVSAGISFVALSRVRRLENLVLSAFSMDRLISLSRNQQIRDRKAEESKLLSLKST